MKLEIYQEKPEEIKEKPVRLAFKVEDGSVVVHVVDKNGGHVSRGNLVEFLSNGKLRVCTYVNPEFGFQLDKRERIQVVQ